MTNNIIKRMISNDLIIRKNIKNGYYKLNMTLDNKEIELYLTDTCLIYNKKYIEYKYIKNIKEYINEPTTFIYCGKRYAIIRSPDISIEYYQNFIYALKLMSYNSKGVKMKKVITICLLIFSMLIYAACGTTTNTNNNQKVEIKSETEAETNTYISQESEPQDEENKITEETKADNEKVEVLKAIPLKFKESTKTDFVKLTFQSVSAVDELKPSNPDRIYRYLPDEENEKYIYAKGTIKNLGSEKFEFASNSYAKVTIDDKYTYDCQIYAEEDNGSTFSYIYANLNPMVKETFYIIAQVPDEVINKYNKATFEYGFTENFDTGFLNREECKYMFSISATK